MSNSAWGEPVMLDDAPNADHVRGMFAASDGVGRLGAAHTTTSHRPSSMAAAARHTMPIGVAPPRSTRSAKLTPQPRYSATVDGTNISDSRSVEQHRPLTSCDVRPASCQRQRSQVGPLLEREAALAPVLPLRRVLGDPGDDRVTSQPHGAGS